MKNQISDMIKRYLIVIILTVLAILPAQAQVKKQEGLKREVTLYNPYKPSLPEVKKRNFLPDMNDTSKVRIDVRYDVKTTAFMPEYTISPIKAAALLPDPLPKLYKSYINFGLGNYLTPLAEISITNERSKKGAIGFYGRHFSTNAKVGLENGKRVFAGYMDNDASLFGKRFFRKNNLEGSIDVSQKYRYAYGYSPAFTDYSPSKKDIRSSFAKIGGRALFSSSTLDSTEFSYKFGLSYDYFTTYDNLYERKLALSGKMSKSYNELYLGAGLNYYYYKIPDFLLEPPKYIASVSPFLSKSSDQWSFKLGLEALLDRNMTSTARAHLYPDVNFSFNVVPKYINFFASLTGKHERNEPMNVVAVNPYVIHDGSLFTVPNTSHDLIITGGLKGNSGIGGNYVVSASYSLISNMLFYSNIVFPDTVRPPDRGNYFSVMTDDVELLNIHAQMEGPISEKLSYNSIINFYKYTLSKFDFAWNRPDWDVTLGLKYNLRDKIIAGMQLNVEGPRKQIVNGQNLGVSGLPLSRQPAVFEMPAYVNLNLSAEYRYSKILSIWAKFNSISNNRYFDWMFYPSQGFLMMFGFTYSL